MTIRGQTLAAERAWSEQKVHYLGDESEDVRHADHMEPPLQARDGWHSLAVIFSFWFGVFIAAPFAFGFGGALAQVYLRGLV